MDPISSIKVSGTSYEVKDSTARSAIVTLNNELNKKATSQIIDVANLTDQEQEALIQTADRAKGIPFGQVDSTSIATAFTATVPGITELREGVCVYLMNGVVASAAATSSPKCFTLNINNLGAKPVYYSTAAASYATTLFGINSTMLFIYNTTRVATGCWDIFYGYDSNTNTIGYQLRTNSTSLPMDSVVYRYRLLFTSADGKKWVPANNSTSTNATASRNTILTKIDPFGRIVYYGYTTSIAAGSIPGVSYMWDLYNVTLGYSFNRTGAALTLTSWEPVYLKCAPLTDGSAIIDANTPYVQALPSTDDGKIYIFLGIATAATTMELTQCHPVYYYKDGAIRLWTGVQSLLDQKANINGSASLNFNAKDVFVHPAGLDSNQYVDINCYYTDEDDTVTLRFTDSVNELSLYYTFDDTNNSHEIATKDYVNTSYNIQMIDLT